MQTLAYARGLIVTAVLGVLALACDHPRLTGNVSLTVSVPSDVSVTTVDYDITGEGLSDTGGNIRVLNPSRTFSKLVSHIPVGEGYVVRVKATSVGGDLQCTGMAGTDVRPNATAVVDVTLTCLAAGDGQIHIAIGVVCPWFAVTSYSVSPLAASVGGTIAVSAMTSDADGAAITYQWTATAGSFEAPTDATTVYTCTTPGSIVLTAIAQTGPCQAARTIPVTCLGDAGVDTD
jgi:hypothetical protein